MRITADVFLLTFFLPSALRVERHVLQTASVSGAVRQETLGKLPDVPVPRKMNSTPEATCTKCEVLSGISIGEVGWGYVDSQDVALNNFHCMVPSTTTVLPRIS